MRHSREAIVSIVLMSAAAFAAPASAQQRAACSLPAQRPFQMHAEFSPFMNTQVFIDTIRNTIGDDLMGYVVLLQGKGGDVIAEINYGFARNPCESRGAQSFTRNTVVEWASVTKLITAAAAIDRTEQSPRYSLDAKMVDFLPARWEIGEAADCAPNRCWKDVKLSDLLSYQGGFADCKRMVDDKCVETFSGPLWDRVAAPKTERAIGSYEYVNANFSAFHYLGRFFTGQTAWDAIENGYRSNEISYEDYIFAKNRALWKQTLKTRIFDPVGIKGDCAKIDFNGNNYALYYLGPNSKKGYFVNPTELRNCASGGVVMSVRDMGKFMHALTRTDTIIDNANYKSLMAVNNNDRLAYNGNYTVSDGQAYGKAGGSAPSGTPSSPTAGDGSAIPGNTAEGVAKSYVMAFPNGMTAVFAANSDIPDNEETWSRRGVLISAYNAGLAAKEPSRARRRVGDGQN